MVTIKKTTELAPGDFITYLGDVVKVDYIIRLRRCAQVTLSYYEKDKGRFAVWSARLSNDLEWRVTNESA